MFKRLLLVLTGVAAMLLVGCATPTKMALAESGEKIASDNTPIYLMTLTLKNAYRTSYQPKMLVMHVNKEGAQEAKDRLSFKTDPKSLDEVGTPEAGNRYFLRMELANGKYVLEGATAVSGIFPVRGFFFAPLHSDLPAGGKPGGVYYLGHVEATVRERQGNEFRAGGPLPLIDQAVVGASGGTFDVVISDQWGADEALFKKRFAALENITVEKAILPPFDRAKAQAWWEAH